MNKLIIIILLLITGIACNEKPEKVKESFIISREQSETICVSTMKKILKSTGFEDETFQIKNIYKLNVELDSEIYKNSIFEKGLYIGLEPKSDTLQERILCLFPFSGEIRMCNTANDKLIINNCWFYSTPLNEFGKNNCFGLDSTTQSMNFEEYQHGFWFHGDKYELNGMWKIKDSDTSRFENKLFNNTWEIKNNEISFTDHNLDTIFESKYRFHKDSLYVQDIDYSFLVLTYTESCIVLGDYKTDGVKFLYKIKK